MLFWWIFSQKIQKGILVGVVASIFSLPFGKILHNNKRPVTSSGHFWVRRMFLGNFCKLSKTILV